MSVGAKDDEHKSICRKICDRLYYLLVQSDYELIKGGNGLFLVLSAVVLFTQAGYLHSSTTLAQLLTWLNQTQWAFVLSIVGVAELVLLIITGNPPMFSKSDNDILRWLWIGAAGFWVCMILYALFAVLLTPPNFSFGLGNVVYGIAALGSLLGAVRSGAAIRRVQRSMLQSVQSELYATAILGS